MSGPDDILTKEQWAEIRDCKECDLLEKHFLIYDERENPGFSGREPWLVIDAECEKICHCRTEAMANAVGRALEDAPDFGGCDVYVWCRAHAPLGRRWEEARAKEADESL